MYQVGMIGGKYLPLHLGHVDSILKAYTMCHELYIVLSYNPEREKLLFENTNMEPIPYQERHKWLYQITKDLNNVHIIDVLDDADNEESYDWNKGANDIRQAINKPINAVFHSDPCNRNLFIELYPEAEVITFDRTNIPISGTMMRRRIYEHWDLVPNVVKPYFTKRVCVIGTESCAKSTLVRNLAKYFNTNCVEEYGREICEKVGGAENLQIKDYYEIAIGHKQKEYEAIQQSNKVLFIDTDALITAYYMDLYTSPVNSPLFNAINSINNYDLYLFLEPDVEWVQDGTRLHGEQDTRIINNLSVKALFDFHNVPYVSINGTYIERFEKAIQETKNLFGGNK